jgi:uncharacterized protein (TIGR03437 family)
MADTTFTGTVEALPTAQPKTLIGQWTVSGKAVIVSNKTDIDQDRGPVDVGSCVAVTGTTNTNGSIAATGIEVRRGQGGCKGNSGNDDDDKSDVDFRGTVTAIAKSGSTSTWTVSGRMVQVSADTKIEPRGNPPELNDCVDVQGNLTGTTLVASRIQGLGKGACRAEKGHEDTPRLIGLIEKLPAVSTLIGDWTVSGQQVKVTADTDLEHDQAPFAVGACVEVRGPVQSSVVQATHIETTDPSRCTSITAPGEREIFGTVVSIPAAFPGVMVVDSRNVSVTATTVIDTTKGSLKVGVCVSVRGMLQADGSIVASRVEVQSSSGMCILPGGVVSSGSFSSFAVSPGQIVSIFGLNIGPATEIPLAILPGNTISSNLFHFQVLFDDKPAPILYLSMGQINAVVPCGVTPGKTVKVQVQSNGAWSNAVTVPVVAAWPSIFTQKNSGKGPGAILNVSADGKTRTLNTDSNPALQSSTVEVYATGLGTPSTGCVDGQIVQPNATNTYPTVSGVTATIGGKPANVTYAGSAPGFVTGLFQVNVQVPTGSTGASLPINLQVKTGTTTATSPDGVTISVK